MAVTRRNIVTDSGVRHAFGRGVALLKNDFSGGVTTATLGFGGTPRPVSAYDQFVIWHYVAMNTPTPANAPNPTGRNSAHRGPIFLPWHRFMLLLFEAHLQRVLGDPTFGLPYWDWAADGDDLPSATASTLWSSDGIGGSGTVTSGPFGFAVAKPNSFRVHFDEPLTTGRLTYNATGRALRRQLGLSGTALPTTAAVRALVRNQGTFDRAPWDVTSTGFRNRLEGWVPEATMHNSVHVWVGGDMGPGTSPNDPVFYLNHCNVDRIWQGWLAQHGKVYRPGDTTSGAPVGHRLHDTIGSLVTTTTTTPADMLDVSTVYAYDALPGA